MQGGKLLEHHVRSSRDEIGERRAGPLVRHVQQVHAGGHLEHLAGDVQRMAVAARAEGELARPCFREFDQLAQRAHRHR